MIKKEYKNVNVTKLHAELLEAYVNVILVEQSDEGAQITFADDVDMTLVQSLVDAHDSTSIVPEPSELDILRDYVLDIELRMILKDLEV